MSGQCDFDLEITICLAFERLCSKLSGQFFLVNPLSILGYIGARTVGEIRYIVQGSTWALGKKHKSTAAWQTMQGGPSETHFYRLCRGRTRRLCAGNFHSHFLGRMQTQSSISQISIFPLPVSTIHIADASAIRVRSFHAYLVGCLRP